MTTTITNNANSNAIIKRALLIGSNYINTPQSRLYGCIQDIINVQDVLIKKYGYMPQNITVLRDDIPGQMPTKTAILSALRSLVSSSANCSEIWIHYSGHGTQMKDINGDEKDNLDEAIVPCDYTVGGLISDDVLFDIIKMSLCRTIMCFDSCHSGTVCDLQYSIQYNNGSFVRSVNNNKIITNPNVIMISGCRDEQTSADTYDNVSRKNVGAFTNSLLGVLSKSNYVMDIMIAYNAVCSDLIKTGYTQVPTLSSSSQTPSYVFGKTTFSPVITTTTSSTISSTTSSTTSATIKPSINQTLPTKPPTPPKVQPVKISYIPMIATSPIRPTYTTKMKKDYAKNGTSIKTRMKHLLFYDMGGEG